MLDVYARQDSVDKALLPLRAVDLHVDTLTLFHMDALKRIAHFLGAMRCQ